MFEKTVGSLHLARSAVGAHCRLKPKHAQDKFNIQTDHRPHKKNPELCREVWLWMLPYSVVPSHRKASRLAVNSPASINEVSCGVYYDDMGNSVSCTTWPGSAEGIADRQLATSQKKTVVTVEASRLQYQVSTFDSPKSVIFTSPFSSSKIFPGLRS